MRLPSVFIAATLLVLAWGSAGLAESGDEPPGAARGEAWRVDFRARTTLIAGEQQLFQDTQEELVSWEDRVLEAGPKGNPTRLRRRYLRYRLSGRAAGPGGRSPEQVPVEGREFEIQVDQGHIKGAVTWGSEPDAPVNDGDEAAIARVISPPYGLEIAENILYAASRAYAAGELKEGQRWTLGVGEARDGLALEYLGSEPFRDQPAVAADVEFMHSPGGPWAGLSVTGKLWLTAAGGQPLALRLRGRRENTAGGPRLSQRMEWQRRPRLQAAEDQPGSAVPAVPEGPRYRLAERRPFGGAAQDIRRELSLQLAADDERWTWREIERTRERVLAATPAGEPLRVARALHVERRGGVPGLIDAADETLDTVVVVDTGGAHGDLADAARGPFQAGWTSDGGLSAVFRKRPVAVDERWTLTDEALPHMLGVVFAPGDRRRLDCHLVECRPAAPGANEPALAVTAQGVARLALDLHLERPFPGGGVLAVDLAGEAQVDMGSGLVIEASLHGRANVGGDAPPGGPPAGASGPASLRYAVTTVTPAEGGGSTSGTWYARPLYLSAQRRRVERSRTEERVLTETAADGAVTERTMTVESRASWSETVLDGRGEHAARTLRDWKEHQIERRYSDRPEPEVERSPLLGRELVRSGGGGVSTPTGKLKPAEEEHARVLWDDPAERIINEVWAALPPRPVNAGEVFESEQVEGPDPAPQGRTRLRVEVVGLRASTGNKPPAVRDRGSAPPVLDRGSAPPVLDLRILRTWESTRFGDYAERLEGVLGFDLARARVADLRLSGERTSMTRFGSGASRRERTGLSLDYTVRFPDADAGRAEPSKVRVDPDHAIRLKPGPPLGHRRRVAYNFRVDLDLDAPAAGNRLPQKAGMEVTERSEEEVTGLDAQGLKSVRRTYGELSMVQVEGAHRREKNSPLRGRTVDVTAGPAGSPGLVAADGGPAVPGDPDGLVREPASLLPDVSLTPGEPVTVDARGLLSLIRVGELPWFLDGEAEVRLLEVTEIDGEEIARVAVRLHLESTASDRSGGGPEDLEVEAELSGELRYSLTQGVERSVELRGSVRMEFGSFDPQQVMRATGTIESSIKFEAAQ